MYEFDSSSKPIVSYSFRARVFSYSQSSLSRVALEAGAIFDYCGVETFKVRTLEKNTKKSCFGTNLICVFSDY